jgi:hypothetical protein
VALHAVFLPVVLAIPAMLAIEVAAVSAVFAIVPIVIITMVPVVDADLNALLWSGTGHDDGRCSKSSDQKQRTETTIQKTHDVLLYAGETEFRIPAESECMIGRAKYVRYSTGVQDGKRDG